MLCAITLLHPNETNHALNKLYHASFVERKHIVSQDILANLLSTMFGEQGTKEIIAKVICATPNNFHLLIRRFMQSTSDEVKKLLTSNTEKALQEGCFGLPYFIGMSTLWSLAIFESNLSL